MTRPRKQRLQPRSRAGIVVWPTRQRGQRRLGNAQVFAHLLCQPGCGATLSPNRGGSPHVRDAQPAAAGELRLDSWFGHPFEESVQGA
jgi:hypothetical protein